MLLFFAWCVLLVLAWPIALLALIVLPIVWVLSIPFRVLAVVVDALIACIRAVLFLPARLLGYRG